MDSTLAINFFKGHPSFRLLPNEQIVKATTQLLQDNTRDYDDDPVNRHPLTYGSNEGSLWVRDTICEFNNYKAFKFKASDKNVKSKPEYLNLTSGASYGVLNILLQCTLPHTGYTRQAFIITPTYFLINDCFFDAGFGNKLTAINEVGNDSFDLKMLEDKLIYFEEQVNVNKIEENCNDDFAVLRNPLKAEQDQKKIYRYVIYLIPTYSNPSSHTYNMETRVALIDLARKYDMLIITDDVYDLLNYNISEGQITNNEIPTPMRRLVHLDRETNSDPISFGNTISNATFSKLIAPGLRFGYQESINEKLVSQLSIGGANVSGGTPAQLNSMIVGTLLKNRLAEKILFNFIKTYKDRAAVLYTAMKLYMPEGTAFSKMNGGYFCWVKLPENYDAVAIGKLAKKEGAIVANGSDFEVVGDTRDWGKNCFRLSISFLEREDIRKGIEILGKICKQYRKAASIA
ncbi:hypothetical protein TPHA_0A02080 [Tetrapisispora phaffii CBS 4417]|uniref:Aminotransferase class I/classII large domain-containing protein n=1 Tax=Tetrapisispora phaffii (strain ATCC 24235 / CBS 4417 / NBRC 1672 / NRRL Y-8282 / UCD 70-5) TaxID=1071381 RepID=G8BN12_TETPH|nr:hypothetical protein TPHA_0A02080 [Tetrapisispora phaffii CBS 4417]CCE61290.1 hypothetical protein TPHA_0A02080 [Tetrapisispora phaffii CBS 4417]